VAEAWALLQVEAARRFEEAARATDFFCDYGLATTQADGPLADDARH
jgi:hypothetical protein